MTAPILLDTCAAIWAVDDEISASAVEALNGAERAGLFIYLSPITAWEIGLMTARGRLRLPMSPQSLFARMLQIPHVRLAEMSPDVLILSSFLPGSPPRDPADRILAATAREYGYALMTRDRLLLDYAEHGHIQALTC
jgi:PIN domain nuclease of toxin-antitoxin system